MKTILQLKVKVFLTGCDSLNSFIQCPKGIYRNDTETENIFIINLFYTYEEKRSHKINK